MTRYFASPDQFDGATLHLPKDDALHIIKARRLTVGESIGVVVNDQLETLTVTGISGHSLTFTRERVEPIPPPTFTIDLAISLTKQDAFAETLSACTQLPIRRFIPMTTRHTVPIIKSKDITSKLARWKKLIWMASCQCHRLQLADTLPLQSFESALETIDFDAYDLCVVCDETESTTALKTVLRDQPDARSFLICIGPEGGLHREESDALIDRGAVSVSLGDQILKAPQAAFFATTAVSYEFGTLPPAPYS